VSKRGGEKRKNIQHPKHRLLCMLFKWCHREKKIIRIATIFRRMSDSIEFPVLPLPQIRPVSNNTAITDRSLHVNSGRKRI
jgi:hypothetical protein